MSEDYAVFWRNDEYTQGLFYDLLARAEQDAYDDDFLMQLAAYREAGGDAAHADIFAAQYLLANGDAENAVTCGERAFRMRPAEPAVWSVLSRAYHAAGRHADALVMQGYALNFFHVPITLDLPASVLTQETLDRLSVAAGKANYAPYALSRMRYSPETGLEAESSVFFAEFLPVSQHITPAYYVAAYAEQEVLGNKHWLMNAIRNTPGLAENVG
ncbi:bacterial transcriptional activator domain-containing protein, partial [Selenomonas sp.]|uniref:bacterial transcriptional activator domain-containing protein n=1 Tax=Selenomonas sp. TaxID=2053611 RepID=UPI001CAFFE04